MAVCRQCNHTLSGLDKEIVKGIVWIKCPRCGFREVSVSDVKVARILKHSADWYTIQNMIKALGPAIAVCGIWDLTVAYEALRKVFNNSVKAKGIPLGGYFSNKQAAVTLEDAQEESEFLSQLVEIDFKTLITLIQKISPAVVTYSLDHKDDRPLKALGELASFLKEFLKKSQRATEQYELLYDAENLKPHRYFPQPEEGGPGVI